jgi:urease accessory protein
VAARVRRGDLDASLGVPADVPADGPGDGPALPSFVRVQAQVRATFTHVAGRTMPDRVFETGGLRIRFPRAGTGPRAEGVLLNSAGGITGGDQQGVAISLAAGADVTITTQSAEKIYRADGNDARISNRLDVGPAAALRWLPQETILFDRAQLVRRLDVDLATSATVTLCESIVFGRIARGERVVTGRLLDRWRVRRNGELILAEDLRLDGPIGEHLARPALGGACAATAVLAHIADDADRHVDAVRAALAELGGSAQVEGGCSAWNGLLVARFAAREPHHLRIVLARVITTITAAPLPRVWSF